MRDLRRSIARASRVMVLAPHPDDETLATGGALRWAATAGAQVRVVFMTDGENNPWAQRATEGRWHIRLRDRQRWGARRRREAIDALACLGVGPEGATFLGFPDQQVTECLMSDLESSVRRVAAEIRSWRPTLLFVPALGDHHPDHSATAILGQLAVARCHDRPQVLEYMVHAGAPAEAERSPCFMVLSASERQAKLRAVLCHVSQLWWRRDRMIGFVGRPERFRPAAMDVPALHATAPLSLVDAAAGEIALSIRRNLRVLVGRVRLLMILQTGMIASAQGLDVSESGELQSSSNGNGSGHRVTAVRCGRDLRVTVSAPSLPHAGRLLAKLDVTRERHMGFFDPWPWVSISISHPEPSPSPSRPLDGADPSASTPRPSRR